MCRGRCLARAAAGDAERAVNAAVFSNTLGYYAQSRVRIADAAAAGPAPPEKQLQVRCMPLRRCDSSVLAIAGC